MKQKLAIICALALAACAPVPEHHLTILHVNLPERVLFSPPIYLHRMKIKCFNHINLAFKILLRLFAIHFCDGIFKRLSVLYLLSFCHIVFLFFCKGTN